MLEVVRDTHTVDGVTPQLISCLAQASDVRIGSEQFIELGNMLVEDLPHSMSYEAISQLAMDIGVEAASLLPSCSDQDPGPSGRVEEALAVVAIFAAERGDDETINSIVDFFKAEGIPHRLVKSLRRKPVIGWLSRVAAVI